MNSGNGRQATGTAPDELAAFGGTGGVMQMAQGLQELPENAPCSSTLTRPCGARGQLTRAVVA